MIDFKGLSKSIHVRLFSITKRWSLESSILHAILARSKPVYLVLYDPKQQLHLIEIIFFVFRRHRGIPSGNSFSHNIME